MKEGGKGGARTKSGLAYEKKVDFLSLFEKSPHYTVKETAEKGIYDIFHKSQRVAESFKKHGFYRYLKRRGIQWRTHISRQLLPDDALLVIVRETLFIIEIKFQKVSGSVDEKLQTCDFKRKQYAKLVSPLNLKVEYVYVLSDWFKDLRYKDVLLYINSVNCHYKFSDLPLAFNDLPLAWLGLP